MNGIEGTQVSDISKIDIKDLYGMSEETFNAMLGELENSGEYFEQDLIDLYGSINFANKELKDNDKFYALSNYKYCLAFDNQDTIKNFFGTQFTDSILYWTVPIYWGGADLNRFFPEDSFIQIDIRKPDEVNKVIEIIQNDDYESRIPALKEARNLILNKYNMWPMINEILETGGLNF